MSGTSAGRLGYMNPRLAPTQLVTRDDIIWAAGIFEGDGTCGWSGKTEHAIVCQKDTWLLEKLRSLFGGNIYTNTRTSIDGVDRVIHNWRISGARARGLLQSIYGLLSPRRQKQIRRTLRVGEFS